MTAFNEKFATQHSQNSPKVLLGQDLNKEIYLRKSVFLIIKVTLCDLSSHT